MSGDAWQQAMKQGRFEEAWAICDRSIRERKGEVRYSLPRHLQNIWNGTPLDGRRVLIRCYHGLGDTLQFVRFVPRVREIASSVTLWVQRALIDFLRPSLVGVKLLPLHDGSPEVGYDVDVELMELPHVFRTTLSTIPPAIVLDGGLRAAGVDGSFDVGLMWRAGDWDSSRSLRVEQLDPLLGVDDVQFVPLQADVPPDERGRLPSRGDVSTIPALARRIAACDLVITVDTLTAHLSGSLGVPTWTLLKHDADWRWLDDRDDSPWYPSMRLYRQRTPGAWESVIADVAQDLRAARVPETPYLRWRHSRAAASDTELRRVAIVRIVDQHDLRAAADPDD
jgi:hypothetical protein